MKVYRVLVYETNDPAQLKRQLNLSAVAQKGTTKFGNMSIGSVIFEGKLPHINAQGIVDHELKRLPVFNGVKEAEDAVH